MGCSIHVGFSHRLARKIHTGTKFWKRRQNIFLIKRRGRSWIIRGGTSIVTNFDSTVNYLAIFVFSNTWCSNVLGLSMN